MIEIKFKFPDTGEGVTEGQFLEWEVDEGDEVEEDQVVGEAETDKAVVEIPAPSDGTVDELLADPGDKVEVGDVIMILDTDGGEEGDAGKEKEQNEEQKKHEEGKRESEGGDDEDVDIENSSGGDVLALPKVRKLAQEKGVQLSEIKTGERINEEEVLEAAEDEDAGTEEVEEKEVQDSVSEEVKATPAVRKLAREKGVEIQSIDGSGRGGKITREDVLEASKEEASENSGEEHGKDKVEIEGKEKRIELSKVRKTVGDRMEESRFTAPHVTHFDTADVTELVELREEKKDGVEAHLTYLPFIMKAVQLSMEKHPRINSELDEEDESLIMKNHYDFNIAVDTDEGLMIPLIEEVDEKNIVELAEEIGEKAEKARENELSPEDMRNGTFSITNLGVIGGEEFTPIINYPQAAILGVGKIQQTAEVVEREVQPRSTVKLSLSYDHRIIDGADATRFLNEVIQNLQDPENMILEL
ncbi:MAG: 2-oxo acid dehydrogenase subunit E2 [Candidatus Nanohaloarchaea archaeon]